MRDVLGASRLRRTSTVRLLPPCTFGARPLCGRPVYGWGGRITRASPSPSGPSRLARRSPALRACVEPLRFASYRHAPSCATALRPPVYGWGGRNRTSDAGVKVRCLNRLATPQCAKFAVTMRLPSASSSGERFIPCTTNPATSVGRCRSRASASRDLRRARTGSPRCRSSGFCFLLKPIKCLPDSRIALRDDVKTVVGLLTGEKVAYCDSVGISCQFGVLEHAAGVDVDGRAQQEIDRRRGIDIAESLSNALGPGGVTMDKDRHVCTELQPERSSSWRDPARISTNDSVRRGSSPHPSCHRQAHRPAGSACSPGYRRRANNRYPVAAAGLHGSPGRRPDAAPATWFAREHHRLGPYRERQFVAQVDELEYGLQ